MDKPASSGIERGNGLVWRSLWAVLLLVASCSKGSTGPGDDSAVVPTQLVVRTQPSSTAQSGVARGTQPVVRLRDAGGDDAGQSAVSVTASIATGGGTLGGTTSVMTNASGQATFTNLEITGTLGDRTLSFTSGTLTAATSSSINVNTAGAETQLFIATQPSGATSGAPFAQQPAIQLQDAGGNSVGKAGVAVTVVVVSGPGGLHPRLYCGGIGAGDLGSVYGGATDAGGVRGRRTGGGVSGE